jgi:predicted RNA-binding protein with PUA-like domain
MRLGDHAFFWASNQKQPGIVGIVQIVREAYPDPTQHDQKSEYYDATSAVDDPKWVAVDVKLVRKLAVPITLAELKGLKEESALAGMALFKYSRLSVQHVTPEEWQFVMALEREGTQEEVKV